MKNRSRSNLQHLNVELCVASYCRSLQTLEGTISSALKVFTIHVMPLPLRSALLPAGNKVECAYIVFSLIQCSQIYFKIVNYEYTLLLFHLYCLSYGVSFHHVILYSRKIFQKSLYLIKIFHFEVLFYVCGVSFCANSE